MHRRGIARAQASQRLRRSASGIDHVRISAIGATTGSYERVAVGGRRPYVIMPVVGHGVHG